jgi:hypothetical protein
MCGGARRVAAALMRKILPYFVDVGSRRVAYPA